MSGTDGHSAEPPRELDYEAAHPTVDGAALRDARSIAARIADDEAAADAERERLLQDPLPVLERYATFAEVARPGEQLHAVRTAALIERGGSQPPIGGILYLSSTRLLHVGASGATEVPLSSIDEVAVSLERLLLVRLQDGSDLAVEVDQPRLLRAQVAAARLAARERAGGH